MAFRSRTLPSDHPNMYAASRARPASFSPSAASSTGPTISEYVSSTPRRDGKCQQKEHRIDTSAERVAILNQRKAELEANGGLTQVKQRVHCERYAYTIFHLRDQKMINVHKVNTHPNFCSVIKRSSHFTFDLPLYTVLPG